MAGLVGAITWNLVTWLIGLPSSSSHALIGGMIGSAIAASGWGVVNWERDQGQGADPVAHCAVPRRRVRLPAHSRDHLARRTAGADEGEPRLPQGPARVGGVRGVHARDERRAEDDGHHRPGAGRLGSPRPELRAPSHVGDRRLGDRDGRGDVRRGLAHHQDARPAHREDRPGAGVRGADGVRVDPLGDGALRLPRVDDAHHLRIGARCRRSPRLPRRAVGRRREHPRRLDPDHSRRRAGRRLHGARHAPAGRARDRLRARDPDRRGGVHSRAASSGAGSRRRSSRRRWAQPLPPEVALRRPRACAADGPRRPSRRC